MAYPHDVLLGSHLKMCLQGAFNNMGKYLCCNVNWRKNTSLYLESEHNYILKYACKCTVIKMEGNATER